MVVKTRWVGVVTIAAALAPPTAASGATIAVQGSCFLSAQPVTVTGTGFTPAPP